MNQYYFKKISSSNKIFVGSDIEDGSLESVLREVFSFGNLPLQTSLSRSKANKQRKRSGGGREGNFFFLLILQKFQKRNKKKKNPKRGTHTNKKTLLFSEPKINRPNNVSTPVYEGINFQGWNSFFFVFSSF